MTRQGAASATQMNPGRIRSPAPLSPRWDGAEGLHESNRFCLEVFLGLRTSSQGCLDKPSISEALNFKETGLRKPV